jgi:hypothetical protein
MVFRSQLRCSLELLPGGYEIASLLAITRGLISLGKRAKQERCHPKALERRQQAPAEFLRPSGSFDDDPAALHVLQLDIPPAKLGPKIPASDAASLTIRGPAPRKKSVTWHEPGAKAYGLRVDGLDDQSR